MGNVTTNEKDILLTEYAQAQADYLHNDNFPWQIGSILVAGTFIFWGLLIDKTVCSHVLGIVTFLVALLLSVWILYANHYRQTYLCKLHRMWEIEEKLGMQSHIRFKKGIYNIYGPSGHNMSLFIYCLTCLGGPIIGYLKIGFSWWLMLPIPAIVCSVVWVNCNEKRIKKDLNNLAKKG